MKLNKQKLELTWHGKKDWENPEPRLLIEKEIYESDSKGLEDNLLIYGDNLLGLKSLERDYTGKIKCVYIDPPYNTKSCFKHYNDNMEHSLWLNMMKERLVILHRLLREDGSIWISIDDDECHYLKVLCDEVLGRKNFITNVIWQKKYTQANDARFLSDNHDHILIYSKNVSKFKINLLPRTDQQKKSYKNQDNDSRGPWKSTPIHAKSGNNNKVYIFRNGIKYKPPQGTFHRFSFQRLNKLEENNELYFGKDGNAIPSKKTFLCNVKKGVVSKSIWLFDEVGHNHEAKTESKALIPADPFPTSKPERLMQRILHLATNSGDLVLDSFAGSGTTGAVAHKMGRKWIMIEMEKTCHTHIIPRLNMVINGEDEGGITKQVNWKGGGSYKYLEMAPSLLEKNRLGRWVINKKYNSAMLSEAVCMHSGYKYSPRKDIYWMHGYSTEHDFIYVVAQTLTKAELSRLSNEVGDGRTLMIYCSAFKVDGSEFDNLTIRKIPKAILNKCTWGKDDYSLKIALSKEADRANKRKQVKPSSYSSGYSPRAPIAAKGGM